MNNIKNIVSRQIIDSRGNPTVETDVILENGAMGRAAVPSGASTGKYEAFELRDGKQSFNGKSVQRAVSNVNGVIFDALSGFDATDQSLIDSTLIDLDGTKNKSKLGANAILSVSMASAVAAANSYKIPLYKYLGGTKQFKMPTPMLNVINGGAHANNNLSFQEFMIIPIGVNTFKEAIQRSSEVFHNLKFILEKRKFPTSVGDEGGFAPNLKSEDEALKLVCDAITKSGYKLEKDFLLAIDVAASEFYKGGKYFISSANKKLSSKEFSSLLKKLCNKYPIISLEDPFDENDWDSWTDFNKNHGDKVQLVGDDLYTTNVSRLRMGIEKSASNAILIKLNQIGTLTETLETIEMAHSNNIETVISHRSGETEDSFIADLAVATNSGQIKTGSISRSDRVSKYNQLIRIEELFNSKKTLKNNKFY
tara:strand:- start:135 stop:1403 length:1269 start_codon:yes stop_codon:yes gene_type:complete